MSIKGLFARDVRNIFREKGPEEACIYLFEAIIERLTDLKKTDVELALMLDKALDVTAQLAFGAASMVEKKQDNEGRHDHELDPNTQQLSNDDAKS